MDESKAEHLAENCIRFIKTSGYSVTNFYYQPVYDGCTIGFLDVLETNNQKNYIWGSYVNKYYITCNGGRLTSHNNTNSLSPEEMKKKLLRVAIALNLLKLKT